MKQTMILALFSFLAAVAGGSWFGAYLAPPRPASVPAPSGDTGAVKAKPKPVAAPAPTVAQSAPAVAQTSDTGRVDSAKKGSPVPVAQAATVAPADSARAAARAKSVAKIIANMKPKSAVEVFAKLSDDEVETIVRQLNAKQTASLLAVLPKDRAALLSRRLLEAKPGRQGGS
jgi:hypothetical protein